MRHLISILLCTCFSLGEVQADTVAGLAPCDSAAGKALAADAKRATHWNWGWTSLYTVGLGVQTTLALTTDDDNFRVAITVGAIKTGLGVANQLVRPIRIEGPNPGCLGLRKQLEEAAEIQRKRRGWFPHVSLVVVNIVGTVYVGYETEDWVLAGVGSLIGAAIGELNIFTSPNNVRSGGFHNLSVYPTFDGETQGIGLGGIF